MRRMHIDLPVALSAVIGDNIAYRSLRPQRAGLAFVPPAPLPRKIDAAYGAAVWALLQQLQALTHPTVALQRILVLGDNAGTDGVMFGHLRPFVAHAAALIVDETGGPPTLQPPVDGLAHADGWAMVARWATLLAQQGFVVDAATAVVLDVDKTLLGPKGRNARVIDEARGAAMAAVIREFVGEQWQADAFAEAQYTFNTARFHPFTGDNQDWVAVLCLLTQTGVLPLATLADAILAGAFPTPAALVAHALRTPLNTALRTLLTSIHARTLAGDPTPFKAFREREYRETVARFNLTAALAPAERLQREICVCGEALAQAHRWRDAGALLLALSDKPDEAALPTAALAAQGFVPIHQLPTHVVTLD